MGPEMEPFPTPMPNDRPIPELQVHIHNRVDQPLRVSVLMNHPKIFVPFHAIRSKITRMIGLFHLESSNSPKSPTWRYSELKPLEERCVSESESFECLPDVQPTRNPPSNLCLIMEMLTNTLSTISMVCGTQGANALIKY